MKQVSRKRNKEHINAVDKAGIAVNRAKDDYKRLWMTNNAKVLSEAGAVSMGELKQKRRL